MNKTNRKILLAGIGPGSLGLELLKCLSLDQTILVYGCDIDPVAYGLSDTRFEKTFALNGSNEIEYCHNLLKICSEEGIKFVAPGAEATNRILCKNQDLFRSNGVIPFVNSQEVYGICSDKYSCNAFLAANGLPALETLYVARGNSLDHFDNFPCDVKPSSDSGCRNMVFLAENLKAQFLLVTS